VADAIETDRPSAIGRGAHAVWRAEAERSSQLGVIMRGERRG